MSNPKEQSQIQNLHQKNGVSSILTSLAKTYLGSCQTSMTKWFSENNSPLIKF